MSRRSYNPKPNRRAYPDIPQVSSKVDVQYFLQIVRTASVYVGHEPMCFQPRPFLSSLARRHSRSNVRFPYISTREFQCVFTWNPRKALFAAT